MKSPAYQMGCDSALETVDSIRENGKVCYIGLPQNNVDGSLMADDYTRGFVDAVLLSGLSFRLEVASFDHDGSANKTLGVYFDGYRIPVQGEL